MKTLIATATLALALAFASPDCPIHGKTNPYFTGKTRSVDGILMGEYKCVGGGTAHTFWAKY